MLNSEKISLAVTSGLAMSLALTSVTGAHAMSASITKPYGEWNSPITSDLIVAASIRLDAPSFDGDDIYWLESRPQEKGRSVLVRRTADGKTEDMTPPPFNVRTRVHEYGGGAYIVRDGIVYFANFTDQRVYRQMVGGKPVPVTPENNMRYADFVAVRKTSNLIAVREDHSGSGEAVNTIVLLDGQTEGPGKVLVEGNDFYSAPRVSPDGTKLAWLTWNHPNMPWDGTELWAAELSGDGNLSNAGKVAGGLHESIFQPAWSPDNVLHFVSDRTGWWNLYRYEQETIISLQPMDTEFGQPMWVFGRSTYGFESSRSIICSYSKNGVTRLAHLDLASKSLEDIETPHTDIGNVRVNESSVVYLGGSPSRFSELVFYDLRTGTSDSVQSSSSVKVDADYVVTAQAIEFPTENGQTAHGFFYPPKNADFQGPPDEKPPLLVKSHGGPTGSTDDTIDLNILYWTSRGFAVVDVNYGGSTGFGREYRQRLKKQWGVVDVDDCVNAARYLAERGFVDGERLAVRGGSAGGYTTLAALTFRDVFKAGASYYGISDLEILARDTHKFESRYLDFLVGPYPEQIERYHARSPIHHIGGLNSPVIFFQGLDDEVVPPNQAELMFNALKGKGVKTAYIPFEGEGHGFRRAENQKRALDAELYFYGRIFGFTPADNIEPVDIMNAD